MVKFVIFGLGMVGKSFLKIVKKENLFDADNWYVIDKNPNTENEFLSIGGKKSNFIIADIEQNKYDNLFSVLEKGDYLLDLSSSQTNTDFLKICMEKEIHYLSTSSLPYEEQAGTVPDYHDFCIYKQLKEKNNPNGPTSIIEFGMNPGMVSCFTKQCIKEIVKHDKHEFVAKNRKLLQQMIDDHNYAKVAQMLEIEIVHISDIDTTKTHFEPKEKCVYSTWNIEAFCDETLGRSEISLGTDADHKIFGNEVNTYNKKDGHLLLNTVPVNCIDQSYSPWGSFNGYIVPHEEIYSIADFLSVYDDNKLQYKPSVYFVYKPSDIALNSLLKAYECNFKDFTEHMVQPEDIAEGGEAVGIVVDGKNFTTRYFGNKLLSPIENETPTILQVSASAYSAFRYMLDNPNKGFLFPEELDDDKIINYAKICLKEYESFECPKLKRPLFNKK